MIPRPTTAQDAPRSTIAPADDLQYPRPRTRHTQIGYGNAGAVDGTERRPPRLGNLAREIPTFPQPLLGGFTKGARRTERTRAYETPSGTPTGPR